MVRSRVLMKYLEAGFPEETKAQQETKMIERTWSRTVGACRKVEIGGCPSRAGERPREGRTCTGTRDMEE